MEESAGRRNTKEMYIITRTLTDAGKTAGRPVRDKTGKLLTGQEDLFKIWAEYFRELMNRSPPNETPVIDPVETPRLMKADHAKRKSIWQLSI